MRLRRDVLAQVIGSGLTVSIDDPRLRGFDGSVS
jgi:hypothetical protein